jgi:hypothetical protein
LASQDGRLRQRCIVLFEGFYEWSQLQHNGSSSSSSDKIAHVIRLNDNFSANEHCVDVSDGVGSSSDLLMIGVTDYEYTC